MPALTLHRASLGLQNTALPASSRFRRHPGLSSFRRPPRLILIQKATLAHPHPRGRPGVCLPKRPPQPIPAYTSSPESSPDPLESLRDHVRRGGITGSRQRPFRPARAFEATPAYPCPKGHPCLSLPKRPPRPILAHISASYGPSRDPPEPQRDRVRRDGITRSRQRERSEVGSVGRLLYLENLCFFWADAGLA